MAGHDEFRKKMIDQCGENNYQKAHKHVHLHFVSSESPNGGVFSLNAEEIKLNYGKEEKKLKMHLRSYNVEGESHEDLETQHDENGMEVDKTVLVQEFSVMRRVNFFVADLAVAVKRQGEDRFKNDAVDDELAAALAEDARIGGGRRRVKRSKG